MVNMKSDASVDASREQNRALCMSMQGFACNRIRATSSTCHRLRHTRTTRTHMSDTDSDEDERAKKKISVAERLRRLKPVHETNNGERTADELHTRTQEVSSQLAAAQQQVASLAQPALLTGATMRDYQLDGLRWAVALDACGVGGILGDEMGLGKTLQSIALLAHHRETADPAGGVRFLVLAPLSTLSNWQHQLSEYCPSACVMTYAGDATTRAACRKRITAPQQAGGFDVVIASYEVLMIDAPELSGVAWRTVVIDEAHRLKNRTAVLYRCLLDELRLGDSPRLLLTGTPLQNNADELFSLLHFVAPAVYDAAELFVAELRRDAATARPLWSPLLLRRLKADHVHLPPKVEATLYVPLTPLQRHWYRAVLERNCSALGAASARTLTNVLAALRKCCNHPYLFDGAEPEPFVEGEHLVQASAKLALLDRLLQRLRSRGDRVLLFCTSTTMLDVLQDYLSLRRWAYERLDGSARAEERWQSVASFQGKDASGSGALPFVFLLSTRAGGLGLNLTAANTVIFYDEDFNPQVDRQAVDRAHRIGQTRRVLVLRLLCRGTVEEVVHRRAQAKLRFSDGVMEEDSSAAAAAPPPSLAKQAIAFGLADLLGPGADGGGSGSADGTGAVGRAGAAMPTDEELERLLDGSGSVGEASSSAQASASAPTDVGAADEGDDSIYSFDGKNFAPDKAAARREADTTALAVLVAGKAGGAAAAAGSAGAPGDGGGRGKRRREMSEEETAAEAAEAVRAQEEAKRRKAERAEERKLERWRQAGYTSLALAAEGVTTGAGSSSTAAAAAAADDGETDVDTDADEDADDEAAVGVDGSLRFVVGDAAVARGGGDGATGPRIVLCWVDDRGRWPGRGFFGAVTSQLGDGPRLAYEAAHTHGDLKLGDAHLLDCSATSPGMLLCLIVVLARDKAAPHGTPPTLSMEALGTALSKVACAAAARGSSVHTPRLPAASGAWYGAERLLRKHLPRRAQTFVYYFARKRS